MVLGIEETACIRSKLGMFGRLEDVHSSIWNMQLHINICIHGRLGCTGFSV